MREILFDMDGTIVDFYSYENWLESIREYDETPYKKAKPKYNNYDLLNAIIKDLKYHGYKIKIVSAFPYRDTTTAEFNSRIAKAKKEWLDKHCFPYDELYFIPYEENKSNYSSPDCDISILVDDNPKVRSAFSRGNRAKHNTTIDATKNILIALADLIRKGGFNYE